MELVLPSYCNKYNLILSGCVKKTKKSHKCLVTFKFTAESEARPPDKWHEDSDSIDFHWTVDLPAVCPQRVTHVAQVKPQTKRESKLLRNCFPFCYPQRYGNFLHMLFVPDIETETKEVLFDSQSKLGI